MGRGSCVEVLKAIWPKDPSGKACENNTGLAFFPISSFLTAPRLEAGSF